MKRFLLAAALSAAGFVATAPGALAQDTPVKPQLPTGPPMAPPPQPQQPPRQTNPPAPTQQPQPTQPAQPTAPSRTIDDDNRPAQPLPGSPAPTQPPVPAPNAPTRGIDDDGRPAQPLPADGTVPGATLETKREPSKFFIYTNFNLGLNSNEWNGTNFSVGASPAIGYRITDKLAVGPGIVYTFNNISFDRQLRVLGFPRSLQLHNVGVKAFAQYLVYRGFFVHAEYEVTRAQSYAVLQTGTNQFETREFDVNVTTPLAGVGYRQKLGERAAGDIALLYNFNDGRNDIYGQPVFRFSFLFDIGK